MTPNRTALDYQRIFQAYCKRILHNEACTAHEEIRQRRVREVSFSNLNPHEERQLCTYDEYFKDDAKPGFQVAGKRITAKLLADALRTLPEEKRKAVLLYYFFDKSDVEISEMLKVPRSTVQYRRTSSFEQLKRYLEENADEWDAW